MKGTWECSCGLSLSMFGSHVQYQTLTVTKIATVVAAQQRSAVKLETQVRSAYDCRILHCSPQRSDVERCDSLLQCQCCGPS